MIDHKTKWKHFIYQIKDDQRVLNMMGQGGSTPHELFEDFLDDLRNSHKDMKENLKALLKRLDFNIESVTT